MASGGLPAEELQRLSTWPAEVARSDLAAHFTFSLVDLDAIAASVTAQPDSEALTIYANDGFSRELTADEQQRLSELGVQTSI